MQPKLRHGIKAYWQLAPVASVMFALGVIVQMVATWAMPNESVASTGMVVALASWPFLMWRRRDAYAHAQRACQPLPA